MLLSYQRNVGIKDFIYIMCASCLYLKPFAGSLYFNETSFSTWHLHRNENGSCFFPEGNAESNNQL